MRTIFQSWHVPFAFSRIRSILIDAGIAKAHGNLPLPGPLPQGAREYPLSRPGGGEGGIGQQRYSQVEDTTTIKWFG